MKDKKMGIALIIAIVAVGIVLAVLLVVYLVGYFSTPVSYNSNVYNEFTSGKDTSAADSVTGPPETLIPGDISAVHPDSYYGQLLEIIKDLKPGIDYEEHVVVYATESKDEAQTVAYIVGGEVSGFGDGIAVIRISKTVISLVSELDKRNETEFEVSLNYMYSIN